MAGIEQSKDMLKFVISLGNTLGKTLEDGKIGLTEIPQFLSPMLLAPSAISGAAEIPAEFSDLTDEEKAELVEFVKSEFDLPQDKIEAAVEDGLKLVADIHRFVKKLSD
jgi:hypothetical protein